MTSKSKDRTEDIQPSSCGGRTVDPEQPSELSVKTDNTLISMQTMPKSSQPTKPEEKPAGTTVTTVRTTPAITEKSRIHADMAKAALMQLEKAGLIKRFKVLSVDLTTVQKIRIEFETTLWTEGLELK